MEALRMYGRGMPRPIAEVNSYAEERRTYYWVAACRDRTTTATHSRSDFHRRRATATHSNYNFNRRRNNCDPKTTTTSTDEEQLRPIATATSTNKRNNCTPLQQQIHPPKEQLLPPSSPYIPSFLHPRFFTNHKIKRVCICYI